MKQPRAIILMGFPCAGKTTYALSDRFAGCEYVSPEVMGATVSDTVGHNLLKNKVRYLIHSGRNFVVDDCNHTRDNRKLYIDLLKERAKLNKSAYRVECHYLRATIGECKANADRRRSTGGARLNRRLLIECKRNLEEPMRSEGFTSIVDIPFELAVNSNLTNKAIFFGFDGVVRYSSGYYSYPKHPREICIFDGVNKILRRYHEEGYKLIGLCRQPAIESQDLNEHMARECMLATVRQLQVPVDDMFLCPHMLSRSCGCFPFMVGIAAAQHCIDLSRCIFVGAQPSELQMGRQLGFGRFMHRTDFFHVNSNSDVKKICGPLAN